MAYSFVLGASDGRTLSWAFLSDLDGDGNGEIVITAQSSADLSQGSVYVILSGSLADLDARDGVTDSVIDISQMLPGEGYALDFDGLLSTAGQIRTINAGDVDGDGMDDLLIATPGTGSDPAPSGSAYLISGGSLDALDTQGGGGADGVILLADIDAGSGGYVFRSAASGSLLGTAAQALGDLDGDGRDDIVIAADDDLWIVFGRDAAGLAALDTLGGGAADGVILVEDLPGADAALRLTGAGGPYRPLAIGRIAPQDGGATADSVLVIGAEGGGAMGTLLLLTPDDLAALDDGSNGIDLDRVGTPTGAGYRITPPAGVVSGTLAAIAGDQDGDGFDDLLISYPDSDAFGAGFGRGTSYLLFSSQLAALDAAGPGGVDGVIAAADLATGLGTAGYRFLPAEGVVGFAVELAGDLDGMGKDDFVFTVLDILAPENSGTYIVFGERLADLDAADGIVDRQILLDDTEAGTYFIQGAWIDPVRFDPDEPALLTIGGTAITGKQLDQLDLADGTTDGVIDPANAPPQPLSYRFLGEAAGDGAGASVRFAGDIDGDGTPDLLIGAAGTTYLLRQADLNALDRADGIADGSIDLSEVGPTLGGYRFASADPALEWSVMAAGNADGTGLDDLAIARWDPVAGTGTIFLVDAGTLAALDADADGVIGIDTLAPATGYRFAATVGGGVTAIEGLSFHPVGDVGLGAGPDYVIGIRHNANTTNFLVSGADFAALDRANSGDGSTEDGLIDLADVGQDGLGYVFTTNDSTGVTLAAIGSIGGEAQLLVGAVTASPFLNLRADSGAVFLIGANDWAALDRANSVDGTTEDGNISLFVPEASFTPVEAHVANAGGYMLVGAEYRDAAGFAIAGGRIDGDGDADLLIASADRSSTPVNGVPRSLAGPVHVILATDLAPLDDAGSGTTDGVIDLADVGAATGGYALFGAQGESAGRGGLAVLGDVDGGGGGDLLIGGLAGRSYLVYSEQLAALDTHLGTAADRVIDLPTMTASHGYVFLHAGSSGRVAAIDSDGDGLADRILFGTAGNDLAGTDAGAAYQILLHPDELARIDRRDGAQDGVIELTNTPICFVRGTRIATIRGPVPVEDLRPGDRVLTMDMGYRPLVWTGRTSRLAYGKMAPVRIAAGTLGNARDLWVSPQHRMLIGGAAGAAGAPGAAFVPAIRLANGDTIRQVEGGTVEYFHVMCDRHQVLFAEGAPAESFFPGPQAWKSLPAEARAELRDLFPGLAPEAAERAPGRPGPGPVPGYGPLARPVAARRPPAPCPAAGDPLVLP